jgi:hypothetical protein
MAFTVQHIRSSTEDKRPAPADLVDGQIAVNFQSSAPGLFFKTSDGALIKAGPAYVSPTAPNPVNYTSLSIGELWLDTSSGQNVLMMWNGTEWVDATEGGNVWEIWNDGTSDFIRPKYAYDVIPQSDGASQLGTADYRWQNVFTQDIDLSNEGGANDVDGTWGSYLIQEGEDDLFLINRRNGKKYKFMLEEVK